MKNHLINGLINLITYVEYVLWAFILFFFFSFMNYKIIIYMANKEYRLKYKTKLSILIKYIRYILLRWFMISSLILLFFVIIYLIYFVMKHQNLIQRKFWPNMIEFLSSIMFLIIELFSIDYGFIGSNLISASTGLILGVQVSDISFIVFIIMIISHLHSISLDSHYIKQNNQFNSDMNNINKSLNSQSNQINTLYNENVHLQQMVNKLNNK